MDQTYKRFNGQYQAKCDRVSDQIKIKAERDKNKKRLKIFAIFVNSPLHVPLPYKSVQKPTQGLLETLQTVYAQMSLFTTKQ